MAVDTSVIFHSNSLHIIMANNYVTLIIKPPSIFIVHYITLNHYGIYINWNRKFIFTQRIENNQILYKKPEIRECA